MRILSNYDAALIIGNDAMTDAVNAVPYKYDLGTLAPKDRIPNRFCRVYGQKKHRQGKFIRGQGCNKFLLLFHPASRSGEGNGNCQGQTEIPKYLI